MTTGRENYASFCRRLRPLLSPEDLLDVDLAYVLSKHAHRAQFRKERDPETGKPLRYFEHPRRVALILIDEVGCIDPLLIIVALLHDGVEDTRFVTPERVNRYFGSEAAAIVKMLSKPPKGGPDEPARRRYVENLLKYGDWRALLIKACDRLDNLRSLLHGDRAFQRKQVEETRDKYYAVLDRLVHLAPERYKKGVLGLRTEIKKLIGLYDRKLRPVRRVARAGRAARARRR